MGSLRGMAEAGAEGLGADDRARGADQQGPVAHEVAPLRDGFVHDPLRRVARDARIAEAEGGAGPEGRGVEDHPLGVQVDHPRGQQDRADDAERRRGPCGEVLATHSVPPMTQRGILPSRVC